MRGVWVARVDGSEPRRLLDADAAAVYAASGHLLFVRNGELLAQRFDATSLALGRRGVSPRQRHLGEPRHQPRLAGGVARGADCVWHRQHPAHAVRLVRSTGKRLESVGPADQTNLANLALSADGRRIAFSRGVGSNWDIWVMDMQGTMSRLTSGLAFDFNPFWSPDGRQFSSNPATSNICVAIGQRRCSPSSRC